MLALRRFSLSAMSLLLALFIAACSFPGVGNTSGDNNSTSNVSGSTPGTTSGITPTTGSQPVTEQLNLQFTYASVNYTMISVQEAKSFPDDTNRYDPSDIVVRTEFKEANPITSTQAFSFYGQIVHLLLPDGSAIELNADRFDRPVDPQTSRTNWLDFATTGPILDLSKLGLQMGAADQVQMNIPLTPNANLSQYQPKTVPTSMTLRYRGLTYTITAVMKSLSSNGHQAAIGQVFITLTLKVANPATSTFSPFAGDYMRLQSAGTTNRPAYTTPDNFLNGVSAQSSETGNVVFSMPQGDSSFTLMLLAQSGASGATATFQLA